MSAPRFTASPASSDTPVKAQALAAALDFAESIRDHLVHNIDQDSVVGAARVFESYLNED